jgi:hypothetical protein
LGAPRLDERACATTMTDSAEHGGSLVTEAQWEKFDKDGYVVLEPFQVSRMPADCEGSLRAMTLRLPMTPSESSGRVTYVHVRTSVSVSV